MSEVLDTSPDALARSLGMPILDSLVVDKQHIELAKKIPYPFAKKHLLLALEEKEQEMTIALSDPLNLNAIDELRMLLNKQIKAFFCEERKILAAINECYNHKEGATKQLLEDLQEQSEEEKSEEKVYDLLNAGDETPIIRLLNLILSEAVQQGASDIHFEPFEDDLNIRYRIDGVLQSRHKPPHEHQSKLLTRIKVLAQLDIAEHRLPQDGRIKMKMGGREIDFRVSTIPVAHGERIAMRILHKGNIQLGIDKLGMLPSTLDAFQRLIQRTEGIVLVTGPTGSGKTTTLYSALSDMQSEQNNIMTIEDPVEYKLEGIAQIATHPKIGLTFARGLRHILRQDPDVVMVGEIRDRETAEIAVQAALTGHLVLSTLHTNDAPSAITRLVDMGIEPYLLSSTVAGVLAMRLVRAVCPHCRKRYTPKDEELKELGLEKQKFLYHGKGCDACFGSGYKGRHGIYELMTVDEALRTMIAKKSDAAHLRKGAIKSGMSTLAEHGAHLVRAGITTVSEVLRVCRKS